MGMSGKIILSVILFLSCSHLAGSLPSKTEVDVVFCIDMSGSTNGLIPDFKNKIWDVINGVYKMRPYPRLRVGVIGFSRPSFGKSNAYVKVLCDLTDDYDRISFELSSLKPSIEKGDQYVGAALQTASRLNWSSNPKALRIIYLMGNGTVHAGGNDYRKTCEDLLRKNIFVNTIYCVQQKVVSKEIPGWKFIADNTGGEHFIYKISMLSPLNRISGDARVLVNLNDRLNNTYIYYGINGKSTLNNLLAVDRSTLEMGEIFFYSRVQYKVSEHYQSGQAQWDLINYVKSAGMQLDKIEKTFLPDSLKNMKTGDLEALIQVKKDERNVVISQIRTYMTAIGQDTIQPEENQLQGIILKTINKLAKDKGIVSGR